MPNLPDASPDEMRQMGRQALEVVERYFSDIASLPLMPVTTAEEVRTLLAEPLPVEPTPFAEALATVRDVVYPMCRHNGHPGLFGYVCSPGSAVVTAGDVLVSGLNANVTSWRSAPAGAEMEHVAIDWLKTVLGYPATAAGLFVSGGSMANFSGLAAARTAHAPDFARTGIAPGKGLRVYISEEGHFSSHKAARLLGFGSDNVQSVAVDREFRIDLDDLERRICADRKAGFVPACVVASAGTVNTGAFDPLSDVADIAARHGLWMHVDGAYGGFAALAPSTRPLFAGIDRADSVALDPHKWLYTSMGCGCVLYRNPDAARATFSHEAEYTRPVGLSRDEAFAFWDFGPELSRPFRALPVWLQIKVNGAAALGAAVERNLACAEYFRKLLDEAPDLEVLARGGLSIFCFRCRPQGYEGDLDALNERILVEVQRSGTSYLSNARVHGHFALRGCVLNYRTTEADMDRLLVDVRAAARRVLG
jgi:glutamate/tyrosine decarboxylase-like PLP-dependent enzyme